MTDHELTLELFAELGRHLVIAATVQGIYANSANEFSEMDFEEIAEHAAMQADAVAIVESKHLRPGDPDPE